uniref:Uncharacterized protein n=1 Tax=Parascaris univalens TaxID=6257 RepID=A0A914ZNN7_PARUN
MNKLLWAYKLLGMVRQKASTNAYDLDKVNARCVFNCRRQTKVDRIVDARTLLVGDDEKDDTGTKTHSGDREPFNERLKDQYFSCFELAMVLPNQST